jgi:hypothetical protein
VGKAGLSAGCRGGVLYYPGTIPKRRRVPQLKSARNPKIASRAEFQFIRVEKSTTALAVHKDDWYLTSQ